MKNFNTYTANEWIKEASSKPIPKMLFSEFWFENELSILFADTNLGKSILAVQIADSISKGKAIEGFKLEAEKQKVLYFDFELSSKQFEARYADNYKNHYSFDDNFLRSELDYESPHFDNKKILDCISKEVEMHKTKIVILDNLTFILEDVEKGSLALDFIKKLKQLKTDLDLSILVLAHTPKRDFVKPISNNDLQGSKMLMNFVDSCFAIGKSFLEYNVKYIKQIKQRNCEHIYNESNICLCTITKGAKNNFLQFEFNKYGNEHDHVNNPKADYLEDLELTYRLHQQGKKNTEIAKLLGVSEGAIRKRIRKLET
ncbi:AAA family ATPase [Sphingobacterium sp. BN32]|uniref:AAA family ATPase n=1 Tax=Sphingobacterium sp. BN32 TaxID=3058432 RepID=UPI00265D3A89|nr:AAA family ATPase [Sphingobacterium sp. BN32]WKK58579.1 AAA family ATPase [Sphingobacterium sp. BN32]